MAFARESKVVRAATQKAAQKAARKPAQAKKTPLARTMVVQTDSAMVFTKPDMDSNVISYLNAGDTVRVSQRVYGSLHKFYRISLPKGQFGFVATIDVSSAKTSKSAGNSKVKNQAKSKSEQMTAKQMDQAERARIKRELQKPAMLNRWFGLLLGQMQFKEKVPGVKAEDNLLVYGFKMTGPDLLLQGPIMDMNFTLHFGAPEYYKAISRVKPSGFLFTTDALLLMPFGMGDNSGLYFGLGPWIKFSTFKYVAPSGALQTPSKFDIGAAFSAGGMYRFGAFSVRLEGKYVLENVTHNVIQLGLQTLY